MQEVYGFAYVRGKVEGRGEDKVWCMFKFGQMVIPIIEIASK